MAEVVDRWRERAMQLTELCWLEYCQWCGADSPEVVVSASSPSYEGRMMPYYVQVLEELAAAMLPTPCVDELYFLQEARP